MLNQTEGFYEPVIIGAWGRVERWPEHPQENGTNHGEEIGVIFGTLDIVLVIMSTSYQQVAGSYE